MSNKLVRKYDLAFGLAGCTLRPIDSTLLRKIDLCSRLEGDWQVVKEYWIFALKKGEDVETFGMFASGIRQ
jgi:hypothetical protein